MSRQQKTRETGDQLLDRYCDTLLGLHERCEAQGKNFRREMATLAGAHLRGHNGDDCRGLPPLADPPPPAAAPSRPAHKTTQSQGAASNARKPAPGASTMSSGNGTSDLTFMMIRATNVSADTIRQIAEVIAPQLAGDGDPRAVRLPAADPRPALPPAEALDDPPADPVEDTPPPAIEEDPIRRRRRPRKLLGRPVGGRTRLVLRCDQHPGRTFTTKEAAKLAGVKPVTVCAAVSSGRTAGGLMFRRETATAPAPRRQEQSSDDEPDAAREKPTDQEVEPTPGRCWNRFEPKAARTAARQKTGRPKNVSDFNKQHAGITLHYDLGQDTTRGAAAGDVMPTNGQRARAWDPPAPPDLQRKL